MLQNLSSYRKQQNSLQHNSVNSLANARHTANLSHSVIWAVSEAAVKLVFDMPRLILSAEALPAVPGGAFQGFSSNCCSRTPKINLIKVSHFLFLKALNYCPETLHYAIGSPVSQTSKYLQLREREEKESQQVWLIKTLTCATKTIKLLIS